MTSHQSYFRNQTTLHVPLDNSTVNQQRMSIYEYKQKLEEYFTVRSLLFHLY